MNGSKERTSFLLCIKKREKFPVMPSVQYSNHLIYICPAHLCFIQHVYITSPPVHTNWSRFHSNQRDIHPLD